MLVCFPCYPEQQKPSTLKTLTHVHGVLCGHIEDLVQLDNVDVIQFLKDGNLTADQIQR